MQGFGRTVRDRSPVGKRYGGTFLNGVRRGPALADIQVKHKQNLVDHEREKDGGIMDALRKMLAGKREGSHPWRSTPGSMSQGAMYPGKPVPKQQVQQRPA